MNRNQVQGRAKDIAGRVQQKIGQLTRSTSQQVKGAAKQVQGKMQKQVGDAAEAMKHVGWKTRR